jgi:lysophospholipase III
MRLVYNSTTRTTSNSPGVMTRVPGFGNSNTVEWLDPSERSPTKYFYNIAETLVTKLNYTRGKDLHGAPYDFRKGPSNETKSSRVMRL